MLKETRQPTPGPWRVIPIRYTNSDGEFQVAYEIEGHPNTPTNEAEVNAMYMSQAPEMFRILNILEVSVDDKYRLLKEAPMKEAIAFWKDTVKSIRAVVRFLRG